MREGLVRDGMGKVARIEVKQGLLESKDLDQW